MFGCQDYVELMFKFMQIPVESRLNLCKFMFYSAKFSGSSSTDQNLLGYKYSTKVYSAGNSTILYGISSKCRK
mgnify:CR=1 FL=1